MMLLVCLFFFAYKAICKTSNVYFVACLLFFKKNPAVFLNVSSFFIYIKSAETFSRQVLTFKISAYV